MKVIKFSAENIKGLKAIEIQPDEDVVTISGANGAGKSSVLDTIEKVLCGGSLHLRTGTEKGRASIDLGEYTVQRIITEKTDRLVIKNKDGAQYPSPREFLSKFVGPLSIDPLSFIRMKDREQLEVLFRLCPALKDGLAQANAEIERIKIERSEINKEGTRLKVELEKRFIHPAVPDEPVDTAELSKELERAQEENARLQRKQEALTTSKKEAQLAADRVRIIKDTIAQLEMKLAAEKLNVEKCEDESRDAEHEAANLEAELSELKPVDTDPIFQRISEAGQVNERIRQNKEYRELSAKKTSTVNIYSTKGEALREAESAKAKLLSDAEMPIPGLSVNGDGVTYNGIPVPELSTSEKVRVGAAIAKSQNPAAKIILVDDISLLDSHNLQVLHEVLSNFQIWQVVNQDDPKKAEGFFIEEGTIKAAKAAKGEAI